MRNEVDVMRIWRVPPLGKLVVEANGQRYATLAEISDPKLKQRVMAAIGELISFTGGYQNLVDLGLAPALVPVPPKPSPDDEPAAPASPELARQQEEFLARLEAQRDEVANRRVRSGLGKSPESLTRAEPLVTFTETGDVLPPKDTAARPLSIAEQIDAIVQKYVALDPAMHNRGIYLEQNPTGGLRIKVDGLFYEKPADIPDKDVQALIKTAVKEWNSR
jgi:hypothetical protein